MNTIMIIVIIAIYLILMGIIIHYVNKARELNDMNTSLIAYTDSLFNKINDLKNKMIKNANKSKLYDDLMKKYRYALFSCSSCGKIMSKKNTNWIDGKPYCGRCKNAQK